MIELPSAAERIARIAREAGALILRIYASDFSVRGKADASPVTAADDAAEAHITPALRALAPDVPVVAEEAVSRGEVPRVAGRFWLVDPLDGTREFVARNGEFTVNIALIEQGLPVLGVVFAPVLDQLYAGVVGHGAWLEERGQRRPITTGPPMPEGLRVASSRSHGDAAALDAWLAGRCVAAQVRSGSSLKFGHLAQGLADVYPRLGRTMEWDTAAGHAVLRAAGGEVFDLRGHVLRYGKPGFENPHFVAWGQSPAGHAGSGS